MQNIHGYMADASHLFWQYVCIHYSSPALTSFVFAELSPHLPYPGRLYFICPKCCPLKQGLSGQANDTVHFTHSIVTVFMILFVPIASVTYCFIWTGKSPSS